METELMRQLKDTKEWIEENNVMDIIEEALDIEYKFDRMGNLKGFELSLILGGPNIFLEDDKLVGYWGMEKAELFINHSKYLEIFDYLNEIKPC